MGGNLINYPGDCGAPTLDLLTVKLMFNSIISTPNAKFMTIDIKDFYRNTDLAIKWTQMATYSARYDKECTDSLKPES